MANVGGLGGLGGFDPSDFLSVIGQSLLTSPRGAPLSGMPAAIQALNARNDKDAETGAMVLALTKSGMDPATAATLARNPTAAALMISQGNQQRRLQTMQGAVGDAPAMPGSTPGPATAPARSGGLGGLGGGFPASLVGNESGGDYGASNKVPGSGGVGHFGRLQFSRGRLQDAMNAGVIPAGTTPEAFMGSPELQQAAEKWHFGDIDEKIAANGFDKMVGQTIRGTPITIDGMRAVAHLGGSGGLEKFITTGGAYNPADANGTRLSDYFSRHAGNTPAQGAGGDPAAADATRVAQNGGPRMVMSKDNPLPLAGATSTDAAMEPYQVAGAGGKVPVPTQGGPVPKPNVGEETKTMKAWATNTTQWALTKMKQGAILGGEEGKALMELAKGHLELAKPYLKPDEVQERLEAAGIDPRSDVGRDALSAGALSRQQGQKLEANKFEYDRFNKDREFTQKVGNDDRTSGTKEYDAYARQERGAGREPLSRLAYATQLARAGSPQPEGVEDVERAKSVTGFLTKEADRAGTVSQRSADLNTLSTILAHTPTGGGAETRAFLDRVGASIGVSSGKLATQKDAIDAITNRVGPTLRQPGSGAQSDAELRGFLSTLGSLSSMPEGNRLIQSTLRRATDLDVERSSIAAQWQAGKIGAGEARQRIAELDGRSIYGSAEEKALVDRMMSGQPDRAPLKPDETAKKGRWVPGKGVVFD